MVAAAFPAAKLGALVLKQVSKPLANLVKARAKSSPFFRTYICMPPAQFYHWCEVKMKMWSMNLGRAVKIPKLNENMAIDLGAELLGEGIIFTIAAGVLVYEYHRSSTKEAKKEEQREAQLIQIQEELKELYFSKAQQENQISELIRILKVNVPTYNFDPKEIDQKTIPEHHRDGYVREENKSFFGNIQDLLWDAVELILPSVDDEGRPASSKGPIIIQTTKDSHHNPESTVPVSSSNNNCDCSTKSSLVLDPEQKAKELKKSNPSGNNDNDTAPKS